MRTEELPPGREDNLTLLWALDLGLLRCHGGTPSLAWRPGYIAQGAAPRASLRPELALSCLVYGGILDLIYGTLHHADAYWRLRHTALKAFAQKARTLANIKRRLF